jgi:ankyrin repeat protein
MSSLSCGSESHYGILEVSETASQADIRRAYRQKALRHHPDKSSTESATSVFQRIHEAYEVLSSARKRLVYDSRNRNAARNEAAMLRAAEERELRRSVVQNRLIEACKAGLTWDTMKLLRGGCDGDIDGFDEYGQTPLMLAAMGCFTQVVSLLVLYKANVNMANSEGWTALMSAVSSVQEYTTKEGTAHSTIVELLRANAYPNAQTIRGMSSLLLACASGSCIVAKTLLDHAADANSADLNGMSPLMLAADAGSVGVVDALLASAATIDMADKDGRTALMSASSHAHKAVVALLLEARSNVCVRGSEGSTALMFALEGVLDGHQTCHSRKDDAIDVTRLLLQARAQPEYLADDGISPLSLAAETSEFDIMHFLSSSLPEHCSHPDAGRVSQLGG